MTEYCPALIDHKQDFYIITTSCVKQSNGKKLLHNKDTEMKGYSPLHLQIAHHTHRHCLQCPLGPLNNELRI
jgi:hypothetical protein